ncbi:hypothetical protein [Aminipila terrae]
MKYLNATLVIPDTLLEELQNYIQGAIYISQLKRNNVKAGGRTQGIEKK